CLANMLELHSVTTRRSSDLHMHFITGRAEERLSFDMQREIAQRLGYPGHPSQRDVERFMKHYFLTAKDVGDLTAILCAELEDSQDRKSTRLNSSHVKISYAV